MEFNGKVVVITGAGSGIGRALALELASRGASLALCDIEGEGLRTLAEETGRNGKELFTRVVDVSKAWQVEEFAGEVLKAFGRVDILVNCAGVGMGGFFETLTLEDLEWIINANIWGVLHCCHYFYPKMIEQNGTSYIVNVSSGASLVPLPIMSAYCATKSAVVSFSEVLREEAAARGVRVAAVCPGVVATNIIEHGRIRSKGKSSKDGDFAQKVDEFFKKRGMPPERVAKAILKGIEKNRAIIKVGREVYLGDFVYRLSRGFYRFLLRHSVRIAGLLQRG